LQCLAQTPFLRKFLLDISESGEPMTIKLDNEDIVSIVLFIIYLLTIVFFIVSIHLVLTYKMLINKYIEICLDKENKPLNIFGI